VIVLVHGNSVTHAFWDVHPDFSVARRLAQAGYLVVTYDRLGYGNSPYRRADGAGYSLTLSSQRSMLHEIVGQMKAGAYGIAPAGSCAGAGPAVGVASTSVVIVGHSAGGAIVSGYPGRFHDVAAMVQAGFSNQGIPAEAGLYLASVWAPQAAAGKDYWAIAPTVADCERAVLYRPGLLSSIFPDVCRPPSFGEAPAGEAAGLGRVIAENDFAIHQVGAGIPVLLAWEDHDFFFPESTARSETAYWKAHCGCDVESWTQQDTGHALVAHRSMPTFTTEVVAWLARKGLGPEVGE
jgi:pimeloyl-ACP methyl ester carboxylesterase